MRFSNCITPNVVCQPARASILTGLLPLSHGVYDNHVSLDPKIGEQGWAGTLSKNGYRSAFIGKGHFGENPNATPFGAPESRKESANFPQDWSGPYMGFQHVEMMILGHWHDLLPCEKPPRGHHFERWFWGHGKEGEAWKLWQEDFGPKQEAAQTWFSKLPELWHSTTWVTDRTIDYLDNCNDEEPFCLWTSYPDPHHPFDCPEPWSRLHYEDEVDIAKHHQRDLDQRPWWHRASLESEPQAKHEHELILRKEYSRIQPQTDRQLRQMTANYYGELSFIDQGVGRISQKLKESGLAENTIVIFTSDHGDLLGDHGLYLKGPTPYEGLLRLGFIVQGPGIDKNKTIGAPISTLDLAASFYDWAGIDSPADIQSTSIRDLIEGENGSRDVAYSEWNQQPSRTGVELNLRTVRTKTAKLTLELISRAGEMYDLADDPDEMINRFDDPGKKILQKELTDMIKARPGSIMDVMPEHGA
jgi:arylsulfatase A-like enzyme